MTEPDLAFEALAEACSIDWQAEMTDNERGRLNRALKELRSIYPDDVLLPQMIRARAASYRAVYPEIRITPQGLLNAWSSIIEAHQTKLERESVTARERRRIVNPPMTGRDCICGGDKMIIVGQNGMGEDVVIRCWECNGGTMPVGWQS